MRIVLNGVETNNKGAELMLYAIMQEIERRFPDATVILPSFNIQHGYSYIETKLNFRDLPGAFLYNPLGKLHVPGILRRLGLPYEGFTDFRKIKNVDYFIDGSGFAFSDKWNPGKLTYDLWKHRLENYKKQGTKIIFLPQAFGPIEKPWTKQLIGLLSDKATVLMPREEISEKYLLNAGVDKNKVKRYTDFTSLVEGEIPERLRYLKDKVCIIPNLRMVDKGTISMDKYLDLIQKMIDNIHEEGYGVFLLNHEGQGDEDLCYKIQQKVGNVEVVTGLNALEVKGVISLSYLCITSRFHGLASALNSGVPCLATSWSHKYEELYKDYKVSDCIINLLDPTDAEKKIKWLLNPEVNAEMRKKLKEMKPKIQQQTREMWEEIWKL